MECERNQWGHFLKWEEGKEKIGREVVKRDREEKGMFGIPIIAIIAR